MTKAELYESLHAVLLDERAAIRAFDPVALDHASAAKEAVMTRLQTVPADERGPLLEALVALQPDLRHNLILLTHAAAFLAEERQRTAPRRAKAA